MLGDPASVSTRSAPGEDASAADGAAGARPSPVATVIATTYNWPEALDLVLDSLAAQTRQDFEVIIADDGSRDDTRALIDEWRPRFPVPLRHVWQDDQGFRAARVRNLAVRHARGEYVIFLDGDCLVLPRFVEVHLRHGEAGWFTVGRRCFMRRWASRRILADALQPHRWPRAILFPLALFGGSNRPLQLLPIPQSAAQRKNRPTAWNKAQTCNLGVWRTDLLRVGGFEEGYGGYGLEDTDLVIRLFRAGVRRLTLEHAEPVLHLWHGRKKTKPDNRARLEALMASDAIQPERSLLLEAPGAPAPPA